MSASAIAMMIVMLGVFWGGFVALLITALRRRSTEESDAQGADGPQGGEE